MAGGNYPGGLDSFVAKTDDVDDVLAADPNELQVGVVAIETELGTDPAGSCTDVTTRLAHSINDAGWLEFDDCTELTIATGAVTATQNYHKLDTQGDDATDDLDTINGFTAGLFIVLRSVADARNVVIKHNTGNILCAGAADITLDTTGQFAFGVYDTGQSKWMIGHGAATGVTQSGSGANSYIAVYTGASTVEGTDDLQWDGTTLTIGDGTAGRDYIITVNGETLNGIITWMEDEDYFAFSDDILMATTEKVQLRDTAVYVNSDTDGHLDLHADVSIDLNTATNTDLVINFTGTTTSGVLTWMEDEDYFNFGDVVSVGSKTSVDPIAGVALSTAAEGANSIIIATGFKSGGGTTPGGGILLGAANGTQATPTTVADGDRLGFFLSAGYDGDSWVHPSGISFMVDGAVSDGVVPSSIVFATGTGSRTDRLNISSAGTVTINPDGVDADTIIEGDTNQNLLRCDAGNDNITINAAAVSAHYDLMLAGDGVLGLKETTTPTADTNYGKLYTKNDDVLYFQDGAGTEHAIAYA